MKTDGMTRRALLGGVLGTAALCAAPVYANAPGLLRGAGDIRRLSLVNQRTGEQFDSIYWLEGEYIPEVMEEFAFFMRDWRANAITTIDPRLADVMAAVHSMLDTDEPYQLLSGYRTPETNASLRANSRGVARNSYHTRGMAADLRLQSRSSWQMYQAAVAFSGGGVGRYRRSGFVHYDSGPVRTWTG